MLSLPVLFYHGYQHHSKDTLTLASHTFIMPGGAVRSLSTTNDVNRIEAPVTWKAYLICAFASFGGIFFGYDSGYINGATSNPEFIHFIEGPGKDALTSSHSSLIVSILSCGTFFGALIAGDVADIIGRKWTVIIGCVVRTIACPASEDSPENKAFGPFRPPGTIC